jgi:curli production assembly/transport component CsgF
MKKYYLLFTFSILCHFASSAQSFVYKPRNPSFGGDTFNYQWMLSSATVQDKTKEKTTTTTTSTSQSALAEFTASLNRQLLSSLSSKLFKDQFGEDGLKEGTYQFGDYVVNVAPGSEGLIVKISDGKGGETSITVPYY